MRHQTMKLLFHVLVVLFFFFTWKGIIDIRATLNDMRAVQSKLLARFLTNWNFVSVPLPRDSAVVSIFLSSIRSAGAHQPPRVRASRARK